MLLNHNYAIETFLKELYHLHTFYSFKCSGYLHKWQNSVTSSKMYSMACCLIIIHAIETYLERIIPVYHTFHSFKCSVIFTTDKIPKILKCIYHVA